MRTTLLTAAALAVAITLPATASGTPEDIAGWRNTTWGMSVDEAAKALGPDAMPVSVEESTSRKWRFDKLGLDTRLHIPSYNAGGQTFDAKLGFHPTAGLKLVSLNTKVAAPAAEAVFDALERQLTDKYGAAARSEHTAFKSETSWTLSKTTIGLVRLTPGASSARPSPGDTSFLMITYQERGGDDGL